MHYTRQSNHGSKHETEKYKQRIIKNAVLRKVMKKIVLSILFLAVAALSSFAHAITYFGVNAEQYFAHWDFKTYVIDVNGHFKANGFNTGIFAGYGMNMYPNFYLGGEVFADFIPITTSTVFINSINYSVKSKYR